MTSPAAAMAGDMMMVGNMSLAGNVTMPEMCVVETLNFATIFMILMNSIANNRPGNSGRVEQLRASAEIYDFIIVGGGSAGCVVANRCVHSFINKDAVASRLFFHSFFLLLQFNIRCQEGLINQCYVGEEVMKMDTLGESHLTCGQKGVGASFIYNTGQYTDKGQ